MPVNIYITVDLFHYYWDVPDERQLWLAVNAHIAPTETDVLGWVDGSENGASFTYKLVRDTVFAQNMVTVNLADDVDIRLTAIDDAEMVVFDKVNERRIAVEVMDGAQFASDNLDLRGGGNIEPMRLGPFVQAFNHGARQAARGQSDIANFDPSEPTAKPVSWDRLMTVIDLAQAGGARRRLRHSIARNLERVDIMRLPFATEPDVTITNLHSLNGLMFKLGDAGEIPDLSIVRGLSLTLTDPNAEVVTLDLGERPQDAEFLRRFFSNLSGDLDYGQLKATWLGDISRRVHVNDTAMVFAHRQYPDGTHWFRRRREERKGESSTAPNLTLNEVNRILVKYRPKDDEDQPPAAWDRLEWEVYGSFECEMQYYRGYTAADGVGVLSLSPRKQDAPAFFSELAIEPNLLMRAVLYDASGELLKTAYLGRFDLAWDRNNPEAERSSLYFGTMPQGGNVTVVFPRLFANETPIRVTTIREREQDDFGDGEDYWQFVPTSPLPAKRFHHLKLAHPSLAEDADRLIVAVSFIGDVEFTYAQGASSIEAGVQTIVPRPVDVTNESMRTVPAEFLDDLTNFNCLNIFHTWGGRVREHLNLKREDFPVFEEITRTHTLYTYHVRFETPTVPEVDQSQPIFDSRSFFANLYSVLGTDRILAFDVEHTFGTHIDLLETVGVSADFDFPIVLPPDVDNGEATPKHFLTIEYRGGLDNQPEEAVLHFDLDFLKPVSPTDQSAASSHIAAWRAVAEATRAESINLFGRFRRFDYREFLSAGTNNSLAAGLTPVTEFETMHWNVTAEFVLRARQWLNGDLSDGSPIEVILTGARQPKIFRACNLIEFRLEYIRSSDQVPDPQGHWQLVRETRPVESDPNPFGKYGRKVVEVKSADNEYLLVNQRFQQFNQSLLRRSEPIKPRTVGTVETTGVALLRRVLGGGGGEDNVAGAADWLVPEGPIDGTGQGALAEFLTIGFRPIDRTSYLGQNPAFILRRVFSTFEAIIEGHTSASLMNDPAALAAHFSRLEAIGPNYERLVARLSDLALPLPDPDDSDLNKKIKPLVDAARQDDHPVMKAIRTQLTEELIGAPTRFYDVKAYLYARLRSAAGGSVSPDLFKFETSKLIRDSGDSTVVDEDSETVQASLTDLVDTEWFGFLEGLDDIDYDNEFFLTDVKLLTFEAAIDAFAKAEEEETKPPVGGSLSIPIHNGMVSLPRGDQPITGSVNPQTPVELASRKALTDPILLFIGTIEQCQDPGGLDAYIDAPLDLDSLLNGIIAEPITSSNSAVRIVNTPLTNDRSHRRDDFTLSLIYSVTGDEEASQGAWTNAFQNDTFIIDIFADDFVPASPVQKVAAGTPPEALKKILDQLVLQADVTKIEQIETLLSHDAIDFLETLIRPNVQEPISYDDVLTFEIKESTSDAGVDISDVSSTPHGLRAEIYLLKPEVDDFVEGDVDESRFFLLVNLEVVVWQRTTVTLVQGRNISRRIATERVGRRFAPEFGVLSETIVPQDPFSPTWSINLYAYEPMVLQRSIPFSAMDLIQKLLIDDIGVLLSGSEEESDWRDFDLSISVFGDQRPELPQVVISGRTIDDSMTMPIPSKHGRQQFLFQVGDFDRTETDWFHSDYDNVVVEFQWITPSNQMIYRIENRRVSVR